MFHKLDSKWKENLPTEFPFPHYYHVSPVAKFASEKLMNEIPSLFPEYTFGKEHDGSVGKMFGVLIVINEKDELGYLQAFSGRIGDVAKYEGFVPPVFDILEKDGFFRTKELEISGLNEKIELLEKSPELDLLKEKILNVKAQAENDIKQLKTFNKRAKAQRQTERKQLDLLSDDEKKKEENRLSKESQLQHFKLKDLKRQWNEKINAAENDLEVFLTSVKSLKSERAKLSAALQQWIFKQYKFLNAHKDSLDLLDLFGETSLKTPPSGAGDCAAPKLLQYAFENNMKVVSMAEFWYGESPKGIIRKHRKYYPACRGKCQPILTYMLNGIKVEENPLLKSIQGHSTVDILFEDEYLVAVEKPAGILSVPGKEVQHSVLSLLQEKYKDVFAIHRLDMATSGILLFAKTEAVYVAMQKQFQKREVAKEYEALLDGSPKNKKGKISLPLSPSFLNRPMQMHATNGKESITGFEAIKENEDSCFIRFFPQTGRTHQLRVHASHKKGLHCPIKGDVLYGYEADRLYLHASKLTFTHPISKTQIEITSKSGFEL